MKLEEKFFNEIRDILLTRRDDYGEIYLIGGYLRDHFLNKFNKDLDFAVTKNSTKAAREIADYFGGDFYILDKERETARALINLKNQSLIVDVSLINGENILDDLKKRDLTINAMAINLTEPEKIIDPLGGECDLQQKKLRLCTANSLIDDPIRTLRAVRFIQNLSLDYEPSIKSAIITASKNLSSISAERIRDELCKILGLPDLDRSYKLMVEFDILARVFPELLNIKDIPPEFPHINDGLTHSLKLVELVRFFMDCIQKTTKVNENKFLNDVQSLIGKYKNQLNEYSQNFNKLNFSIYSLLALAGLYHDSSKLDISPIKNEGKTIYPNHGEKSAEIVKSRMRLLAFSNEDIDFVSTIVKFHMSPYLKSISEDEKPNRSIYQYFQVTKDLGVMIALFHLADIIATYEKTLSSKRWKSAMKSVDRILDGWFNHFDDVISPHMLLNGNELIWDFGLQPGREIGQILKKIREEQAAGTLIEKKSAIEYAKKMIDEMKIDE